MAPALTQRLALAGAEIDRVCQMLLDPTAEQLDNSSAVLEGIVAEMTACRDAIRAAGPLPDVREQARRLAQSVRQVRLLLESAARFHAEWIRYLGAVCVGYTERGEPGAVARPSHFWAQG